MIEAAIERNLGLNPDALDARVRELELEIRQRQAELAAALAVVDARRDFEADGHQHLHSYVKATINCGRGEATRLVRRAHLVNEEPAVANAWAAGHIGTDQVDRLARASQHPRAGDAFREVRDELLADAEHLAYDDFQTVVARFETLADVDGALAEDRANNQGRAATVTAGSDGVFITARGGTVLQAAEMEAIFQQAKQSEFDIDCERRRAEHGDDANSHPLARTAQQRSLDALYTIFMASVTAPSNRRRPEPLVNIVFDARTAGETLHEHHLVDSASIFTQVEPSLADRRCETSSGHALHPDLALGAMLAGHVRRVVLDSSSVVTDMGREQRLFTGKARSAARLLVARCSSRGCGVPATLCDIDHLESWEDLGATAPRNGAPLCGTHNRDKHRRKLRARRTEDGRIRLIRPDGTVIKPTGEREPDWADLKPHANSGHVGPARTVSWEEFTRTRPHLAEQPDPGWTFMVAEYTAS